MMLGAILLVGLVGIGVTVGRVAEPSMTDVGRADAVLVHAGRTDRLDPGLEFVESGVASVLVVSDVGSDFGRGGRYLERLCRREEPFEVVCPVPQRSSTIGEARAFGALVEERGWKTVVVVTSRAHLTRARLAVSQCTDAELLPVAADPDATPEVGEVAEEWLAAGATATLWRACW